MFDFGDLSDAESGDDGCGESPEELQQQRRADASMSFKPGDVVKARFQQGCWYLASVFHENSDGTYTISWKDGDDHDRVKSSGELIYIRPGDARSAQWSAQGKKPAKPPNAPNTSNKAAKPAEQPWHPPDDRSHRSEPQPSAEREKPSANMRKDSGYQSVPEADKKWSDWDEQQRLFRRELERREEKEDQRWLDGRMAKLQTELREIDQLAPGAKKTRLRKLQLELHPDKQPERIRAKAQQLFLLVQGRWEANEAAFQREAQVKTNQEEERAHRAAREAREEQRRRQRSQEERERQERQREEKERLLREEKERQQKEAEEKRRHNAESRAKQAEQELKRFKEAAARQRSKQNEKSEGAPRGTFPSKGNGTESSEAAMPGKKAQYESADQSDSPILSHGQSGGQKENAPPNKVGASIHVRLRINGMNSNRPTFSVQSTATIGSIRESLHSASGIPIPLQKVYIGDRELFDFETLKQLVKSGNMLDLDIAEVPQKGSALAERIRRNWRMLQHASEEMRSDKDLVLEAVKQSWEALQFASESLKRDREVAFAAVEQDGLALEHVSPTLHSDREMMFTAVQRTWRALRYATFEIASDVDIAFMAVHQDWRALQYLSADLRDNKELLETAVQQSGLALRYASKRLQKDHDTVLAAVRQNGNAFSHACAELRADRQFVLAAVWKNGAALRYVDPDLRADREVALAAVSGWD